MGVFFMFLILGVILLKSLKKYPPPINGSLFYDLNFGSYFVLKVLKK